MNNRTLWDDVERAIKDGMYRLRDDWKGQVPKELFEIYDDALDAFHALKDQYFKTGGRQ